MPIKISPAEWEVLNVLWDRAPATAAEIFEKLPRGKDWHIKTVNTFLARLTEKGIIETRREGRSNVYLPRKTRAQCIQAEGESFLNRVFRGAFAPMLLHFVEKADLSPDEIRDLERLLRNKKKSK